MLNFESHCSENIKECIYLNFSQVSINLFSTNCINKTRLLSLSNLVKWNKLDIDYSVWYVLLQTKPGVLQDYVAGKSLNPNLRVEGESFKESILEEMMSALNLKRMIFNPEGRVLQIGSLYSKS
jgi:hypothetical protein